ncbi:MAG: hypothetical protein M3Y86_12665 [Verrucomicrobiota bacterium]|nr:hypothetical protein [Verrucomicrobiota bacterium]
MLIIRIESTRARPRTGISNLFDEKYYSRIFLTGTIDPAARRSGYAGLSVEF